MHGNIDAFDVLRSSRGDAAFVQGTAVGIGIVAPFTCPCIETDGPVFNFVAVLFISCYYPTYFQVPTRREAKVVKIRRRGRRPCHTTTKV